ncbi:hypothetical protein CL633_03750 [bacterium]|nr:hypothetical protein [bacterium]|tara:strand:+ start:4108 stop:5655 length:1548 start_codon:yes stop_codon:yes gene_type:complete
MPKIKLISLKDQVLDPELLQLVPQEVAQFYNFVPFEKKKNLLKIGIVDPSNINALEALKFISQRYNFKIKLYKIDLGEFQEVVKQYESFKGEVRKALKTLETEKQKQKQGNVSTDATNKEQIRRLAQEAPITKMVSVILKHAVEGKASDIHIEGTDKDLRVRFRVDGVLYTSLMLPKKVQPAVVSRIKILSNLKIDEQRKPQDGRLQTVVSNRAIDFRVSTFPTVNGEKVVMRVLDKSAGLRNLEELGLQGRNLKVIEQAIKKPYGMILITGPTGSGKSTTLYAILKILNQEGINIITLEDPVEYYMNGINQSQVKPEIGYNFASGLRSILRQDPDVIMVGEIRDKETAELAVHAALTGHVVLSTLHTNSAVGAIPRLMDMGIESFLLTSALNIVIAQRLVKRIKKAGKIEQVKPAIKEMIEKGLDGMPEDQKKDLKLKFDGNLPGNNELKGRVGLYEVLVMTDNLEKIILENQPEQAIINEAKNQGMMSMEQDGIIKIVKHLTTLKEVLRVIKS